MAGTAAVLFVFGAICVAVYEPMKSPKVKNVPEQRDVTGQTVTFQVKLDDVKDVAKQKVTLDDVKDAAEQKVTPDDVKKVTLDDVIVSDELKEDLKVIFDGMSEKTKENFKILGLTPAQGYLFHGPPGTGKTLLARAIAGEAKISFLNISASELVGEYANQGVYRVQDFFEKARKKAPCIVFIDEIDSIGAKRISDSSSVSQDHNKTLIQLLNEMDGFDSNKGITVIAATNRPEVLDKALLRRFPEKINISLPDVSSREKILRLQMGTAPAESGLSLEKVAEETEGYSGDDLKNLVRKVKFRVAKHKEGEEVIITKNDFTTALKEFDDKHKEFENEEASNTGDNIVNKLLQGILCNPANTTKVSVAS
ncbi:ATP-binding protein [Wolbachia endosymbiont of Oedothorax gibbosus]|uniref:ATP-binding protein n=1 Tax=Wolbachia endosymbiont of Oedothorax gibbosus TaxID=931100 RepID=UPI002023FFC3|nr:AAA family ATPase [Wolbachia endosymbiont of Oedothorax gibbosus]